MYKQFPLDEIFKSFLLGLRFDLAAICLLNIPIILLALYPGKNSRFLFFDRLLFILINSAGLIASLDDYELFFFMGKRLSFDLFVITDDIWAQLPQLIVNYWYFPLMGVAFGIGYYFFDHRYFKLKEANPKLTIKITSSVAILALSFIGIRGGLQHKSINVQSAFTQGRNELGHLVLNTPYHFLRTLKNKTVEKMKYFKTDEEAINVIVSRRDLRRLKYEAYKMNVVLIILESFSSEYMEEGFTPFLSELKERSVYFPHHLANGRRSIEALPSLLCGLPALIDEPISKSIFQGNKFTCMPKLLKQAGYTNFFFHGGAKGTMGFEAYTLANGFDRYFSKNDYPGKADFDGTWGIFDEPFLLFAADEISKMPEPFMAGIFTLSSHQPYTVPKEFKGKFPKGKLEIHESIGYADYALKRFFEKIKGQSWVKNTLFVITSDHSQKLHSKKFQNAIGRYRVPLFFYSEGKLGLTDTQKVTQHSDIPRTVLDLVGVYGDELPATSVSMLGTDKGYTLNLVDGAYLMVGEQETLRLTREGQQERLIYDWDTGALNSAGPSDDKLLKAYLQYYFNGLINNNLSIYR